MPTLRLVLGDQLNPNHSWFKDVRSEVVYVLMEVRQETDYVLHHAQKILAIFAGMRDFARQLREAGHRVHYVSIGDPQNRHGLRANLDWLIPLYEAEAFEYQFPDEWRLDSQLAEEAAHRSIPCRGVDSEHFLSTRGEAAEVFKGRKSWLMEHFYRRMRTRHRVLLEEDGSPAGGAWNFDHDNRKPWRGQPPEPEDSRNTHDHSSLWEEVTAAGVRSFGEPKAACLPWPLNRSEALLQLEAFIRERLPHFGDFQDAMSSRARRLFHSLVSFALNTKMLHPGEVVAAAEAAWRRGHAPLASVEGFIRQILGWREYVRGVYWHHMPAYTEKNALAHTRPLPEWFWTGKTRMRCLSHAIGDSLENAHAHHIQRLMVIGNFGLLAGIDPGELHRWYLGVYIDAFEWVEAPNTLGMSQYADGGTLASKPYVSSAAYIHKMSDYCTGCHYDKKLRNGPRACPFNAFYWAFFLRHQGAFAKNPRLSIVYKQLSKMDEDSIRAIHEQAAENWDRLSDL